MVKKFAGWRVLILVLALAFETQPLVRAQPAESLALLRKAYATLAVADHDYRGHRVAAMHQIEEAALLLKLDLRGDGIGRERQGVSDAQMALARGLLEQARVGLAGRPLKHVNRAINQISAGLRIR